MRKISMLVLACSALAVALPAAAQNYGGRDPNYGGGAYDRGYDRGFDREWGRRGGGFERELQQLNRQTQADWERGVIGKKVAKAFFNRIQELQRAENRARDKNGGWLDPQQTRDMRRAVEQVRRDLAQHESQYRGGYGYDYRR